MRGYVSCNTSLVKAHAVALAVAVLIAAPSALAKGPDTARICGESGCVRVDDVEAVNVLAFAESGFSSRTEPHPAPFFTVELTSSRVSEVRWHFVYVPSERALKIVQADFSGGIYETAATNTWVSPSDDAMATYQDAVAGMDPFAADSAWVAPTDDGWSVVWLPAVAALAAAFAAIAVASRRLLARARPFPRTRHLDVPSPAVRREGP